MTHAPAQHFVLYAQGLLQFLIPLSVILFEPTAAGRRKMLPFVAMGLGLTLFMLWGPIAYPLQVYIEHNSIVYINQATNQT